MVLNVSSNAQVDKQALPLPFMLQFLESASPVVLDDPTGGAPTPYQTGLDNKFVDDTMEDADEDDPSLPTQTGVIADSDNKEDDDE